MGAPDWSSFGKRKIVNITRKGDQGSTFGGNPICSQAAQIVVNTIAQTDFLKNVIETGSIYNNNFIKPNKSLMI